MITDFLINVLYSVVLGLAQFLGQWGDVSADNNLTEAIVNARSVYVSLEPILPIVVILAVFAFDLAFEGIWALYKLIRWGYKKIPGID